MSTTRVGRHLALTAAVLILAIAPCARAQTQRAFATPEDAARGLADAAKANGVDALLSIFGPSSRDLLESSDAETTTRNRETFIVAFAERWRVVDLDATRKELVIGNEQWPFPIPLVHRADGWVFDTAAGREEVIARRIGRNELAAIDICRSYLRAQRMYASASHDGNAPGSYAMRFASTPGRHDGLYWPAEPGTRRSPLGDLMADAENDLSARQASAGPATPFHGYYFRVLTAQGASAPGGARSYVEQDQMTGGFALIAWPAQYDATGVMTFLVNHDGIVFEKDLGPDTAGAAGRITAYDPDATWTKSLGR